MSEYRTDDDLLIQAKNLNVEAKLLLYQEELHSTIQNYGTTVIYGSVALDLMVRREMDLYVQLPDDQDIPLFFEIGAAITRKHEVLKASYTNHFIRNFPGFDHGLFWGISLRYSQQRWKLDLWGHGPSYFAEHLTQFTQLQNELKEIDPVIILRIKDALQAEDGYLNGISANDIYMAVLRANVKTVNQFLDWWDHRATHQNLG